jgi:hypothetical protein
LQHRKQLDEKVDMCKLCKQQDKTRRDATYNSKRITYAISVAALVGRDPVRVPPVDLAEAAARVDGDYLARRRLDTESAAGRGEVAQR